VQEYERVDSVRIVCRLAGKILLRSGIGTGEPDRNRHRNGIAPNMVHSVDASHMALVACSGADAGLSLAMIHDDFGCHAADAGRLYSIIRETFVKMHENSRPLDRLASAYGLPNPPADGALDLKQVLDSPYFFS
jgi:DNA-directed RNA polymerase